MPLVFGAPRQIPPQPPRATIVSGTLELAPITMTGYESSRETTSLVHEILGRATPDITLRPARSRTGTLTLVFALEVDALAAEAAHAEGRIFTIQHPTRSSIDMDYVPAGRVVRALLPTGDWTVSIDFQEV